MEGWNALEAFCLSEVGPIAPESRAFGGPHLAAEGSREGLLIATGLCK